MEGTVTISISDYEMLKLAKKAVDENKISMDYYQSGYMYYGKDEVIQRLIQDNDRLENNEKVLSDDIGVMKECLENIKKEYSKIPRFVKRYFGVKV